MKFKTGDIVRLKDGINARSPEAEYWPYFYETMYGLLGRDIEVSKAYYAEAYDANVIYTTEGWTLREDWLEYANEVPSADPAGPVSSLLWAAATSVGDGARPLNLVYEASKDVADDWAVHMADSFILQIVSDESYGVDGWKNKTVNRMILLQAAMLAQDAGY